MILRHRRFWRYLYGPMMLSAGLFLLVMIGGYFLIVPRGEQLVVRLGVPAGLADALGVVIYFGIWFLVSGFVFLSFNSFLSSILWEQLSAEVEVASGGSGQLDTLPRSALVVDSVARGSLAIGVGLASICCAWILPLIGPVLLAGFMGLLDYTAAPYLRRNVTLSRQWRKVTKLPGWPGFLLVSGLISLVPILNVLMLPAMVAGGTLMVMKGGTR